MPMNQLQTAFETTFQTQMQRHSFALALQLFERKAKEAGLTLSKFQLQRIRKRLESSDRSDFQLRFPNIKAKGSRKITITKKDIREMTKHYKAIMSGSGLGDVIDKVSESASSRMLLSLKKDWPRQSKYERSILNGFKKRLRQRWGTPLELLAMLIKVAVELGADVNEDSRNGKNSKLPYTVEALTRLHARACQIAAEVLLLLKSGFADGAMARWRTLHEITVVVFFIQKYGEAAAERYLCHMPVESYKAAIQYQRHCKLLGYAPLTRSELKDIRTAYSAALNRFGQPFGGNYGWASDALKKKNPTFADIERHVRFEHFRPYYKMASHNVHAEPKGAFHRLGLPEGGLLLAGPSDAGLADPGQNTALSLTKTTSTLLSLKCTLDIMVGLKIMLTLSDDVGKAFILAQEQYSNEASALDQLQARAGRTRKTGAGNFSGGA